MMQPQFDKEFEDPVLKSAVRRCWSCDCASTELKKKIDSMLGESPGQQRPMGKLSWFIWPVGVAASVILVIGLLHRIQHHVQSTAPVAIASELPVSLQNDLISRHDLCCKEKDHQHLNAAKNDDAGITAALHQLLKRPVLVFHPQDRNWQFRGASVCPVGSTPAAHLVFVKGNDALSIFSLPKSLFPSASEGSEFSADMNQHHIVAFVKDGALFCLVASGPGISITTDELKNMESQMQSAVARSLDTQPQTVLLTELLQPINQ